MESALSACHRNDTTDHVIQLFTVLSSPKLVECYRYRDLDVGHSVGVLIYNYTYRSASFKALSLMPINVP